MYFFANLFSPNACKFENIILALCNPQALVKFIKYRFLIVFRTTYPIVFQKQIGGLKISEASWQEVRFFNSLKVHSPFIVINTNFKALGPHHNKPGLQLFAFFVLRIHPIVGPVPHNFAIGLWVVWKWAN